MGARGAGPPLTGRPREILEVGRQALREAVRDNLAGEAAKAAYYFFLSFFPLILAIFAFAGIFGGDELFRAVIGPLRSAAPGETERLLEELVREVTSDSRPGLLSLGLLLTLWSASNVFAALADGLNTMWDVAEDRSWWKRRAMALVALVAAYVLLLPAAAAILGGPELIGLAGLGPVWAWLRWPLAFVALVAVLWVVYHLLPARDQRAHRREVLVGALVGTCAWIGVTLGFRAYVVGFGSYGRTYGFLGGIIVLLLWLYLTALAILFGGEVAATLEQRARQGVGVDGRDPAAKGSASEP